jgi:hypothetical protein
VLGDAQADVQLPLVPRQLLLLGLKFAAKVELRGTVLVLVVLACNSNRIAADAYIVLTLLLEATLNFLRLSQAANKASFSFHKRAGVSQTALIDAYV